MYWLLIEGDNGTGKDTLRLQFEQEDWLHVDAGVEASSALAKARKHRGLERIPAYLTYCEVCADLATKSRRDCVMVRYWPSTLAAGYADELLSETEFERMVKDCVSRFAEPNGVIELRCDSGNRVQRILERIPDPLGHPDNLDNERGARYRAAMERIASRWDCPWLFLDTTILTPNQVFKAARDWVAEQKRGSNDTCGT